MWRTSIAVLALLVVACGDDDLTSDGGGIADGGRRDSGGLDGGPDVDGAGVDGGGGGEVDASMPARARLMYVSVGGEARLAVVELGADGSMTAMSGMDVTLPANPGPLAYARATRRLYVGFGDAIGTITLDGAGVPTYVGRTEGTGNPVYLSVAHDDGVLVSAYFGDDVIKTHDVSGMPPHAELDRLTTSDEPHCALIGPTGDRVYVPHRDGNVTRWFDLAADGALAFDSELAGESGVGPRHIAFAPSGEYAYVINEYADSVSAHRVGADGSLERFQTISTLPMGVAGDSNTGADVHVTPSGRFLYGSNRGHDSLAMFSIGSDGTLISLGTISTEATPREFDMSPDGRFIVAAGQGSGALQSYRIEDDGTLTSVDRLEVGSSLLWVIID